MQPWLNVHGSTKQLTVGSPFGQPKDPTTLISTPEKRSVNNYILNSEFVLILGHMLEEIFPQLMGPS